MPMYVSDMDPCHLICTAALTHPTPSVGEKDTPWEDVEEVTYNPGADFGLRLPTAHRRLREERQIRDEAAVAAAVAAARAKSQAALFTPVQRRGAAVGGGSGSSDGARALHTAAAQRWRHELIGSSICCQCSSSSNSSLMCTCLCSSRDSSSIGSSPVLLPHTPYSPLMLCSRPRSGLGFAA